MEKEADPNPLGICEKIFKVLFTDSSSCPHGRITNTPVESSATTAPTAIPDRKIEIEDTPPKHKHVPPPPLAVLPEKKVEPTAKPAQPVRLHIEDKIPTKMITAPTPAPSTAQKKDNIPAMVEQPIIPTTPHVAVPMVAAPILENKERENIAASFEQPEVAKEKGKVSGRESPAAVASVELPTTRPTAAEKGPVQRMPTSRFTEYMARARNAIRTTSNAGAAATAVEKGPPPTIHEEPTVTLPVTASPKPATKERENIAARVEQPEVGKERGKVGGSVESPAGIARVELPTARLTAAEKKAAQRMPTSRFEEFLGRAGKAIRTTSNVGEAAKQELRKQSK